MAVMALMEFEGGTIEQYEQINEALGIRGPQDAPAGLIRHVVGESDDGLVIIDLWESPEAMEDFYENSLRKASEQVGDIPEVQPRIAPVHNHLSGSGEIAGVIVIAEVPDAGTDVYDQVRDEIPGHDENHPSVSHAAAITDDGLLIVDVWESEEAFGRYAGEKVAPAGEKAGMTGFEPRFVKVHGHMEGPAGAGS
jgi:quinol monooxygenase YgiN